MTGLHTHLRQQIKVTMWALGRFVGPLSSVEASLADTYINHLQGIAKQ